MLQAGRSGVHLHIQVLQTDGGILACAVNACCLALIDAGIPISDFVSCTTIGIVQPKGSEPQALLDLNYIEENQEVPCITVAVVRGSGRVALMHVCVELTQMESRMHLDHFENVLLLAKIGCSTIADSLEETVRNHAKSVA
jgi:exosome complex component RRP41